MKLIKKADGNDLCVKSGFPVMCWVVFALRVSRLMKT